MEQLISELIAVDPSGAELRVDPETKEIGHISMLGDVTTISDPVMLSLVESSHYACLHVFPGRSVVLLGDTSRFLVRVSWDKPWVHLLAELERTEVLEEGFDYCVFYEHRQGVVVCFELGAVGLSSHGEVRWRRSFDFLHVFPKFEDSQIIYRENDGDVVYSLLDGQNVVSRLDDS